jgi:quinol monooxygenase YgiN
MRVGMVKPFSNCSPHFQRWRDTVAEMMAEPRSSAKYTNVLPDNPGWG